MDVIVGAFVFPEATSAATARPRLKNDGLAELLLCGTGERETPEGQSCFFFFLKRVDWIQSEFQKQIPVEPVNSVNSNVYARTPPGTPITVFFHKRVCDEISLYPPSIIGYNYTYSAVRCTYYNLVR